MRLYTLPDCVGLENQYFSQSVVYGCYIWSGILVKTDDLDDICETLHFGRDESVWNSKSRLFLITEGLLYILKHS